MKENVTVFGAIGAAILAFACCIGPVVLAGLSVGAVAFAQQFAPWRPFFLALTAILLGVGFYFAYRRPRQIACADGSCTTLGTARWARPLLWVITGIVVTLVAFPYYYGPLRAAFERPVRSTGAAPAQARLATAELQITGMTCEGCAEVVKSKLLEVPGVAEAEVQYPTGRAQVKYDPTRTEPDKLIVAVNAAGYHASFSGSEAR